MSLTVALTLLSLLAMVLLAWQWAAGARFPLHWRFADTSFAPGVTLLKPMKGADERTERCLRSWLTQDYEGRTQLLIGVESDADPAFAIAAKVLSEFPKTDAELLVCRELQGANPKVGKLDFLEAKARHGILIISDADMEAPPDLLRNIVQPLFQPQTGLVNCLYRMMDADNLPARWEMTGANVDFWSQVLQSNALKPMDFALGATMAVRREALAAIGGFKALGDCIADDYQLGHKLSRAGFRIHLSSVVVDCRSGLANWRTIWKHQLRWARTIRVCQPVPYFFSIVANATLWPVLLAIIDPALETLAFALVCGSIRVIAGLDLKRRFEWNGKPARFDWPNGPVILLKDLLQSIIWASAFLGSTVEWRGNKFKLRRDGSMMKVI